MPPRRNDRAGSDDEPERSKLGVLVPETVQDDNRALVKYLHDGSKRNKLGPETTDRLTHALALYFWQNPDELKSVAYSKHTDVEPEAFMQRIKEYQEKHLEETHEAMKQVAEQAAEKTHEIRKERPEIPISSDQPTQQIGTTTETGSGQRQKPEELAQHDNRIPDDVPLMGDAPQNKTIPQDTRRRGADRAGNIIKEAVGSAEDEIEDEVESRVEEIAAESAKQAVREETRTLERRFASMIDEKLEEMKSNQTDS